jgi:hypothetical protein
MRRVLLFGEDSGHALVLQALTECVARERGLAVQVEVVWAHGGLGRMLGELRRFLQQIQLAREPLPDLLVIGRDANCKGHLQCQQAIRRVVADYPGPVVIAVPDPHLERWLLLDPAAFKTVVGKGCAAPDNKCERDRYKQRLIQAFLDAGIEPTLGGLDFAQEVVEAMDLPRLERKDASLGHLLQDLREQFNQWGQT